MGSLSALLSAMKLTLIALFSGSERVTREDADILCAFHDGAWVTEPNRPGLSYWMKSKLLETTEIGEYKCGVFFKDLTSKVPLAWLGALPEAVVRARKEGATDDDVISLLGSNVDADSYEGDVCGDTLANTRCYAQMTKVK